MTQSDTPLAPLFSVKNAQIEVADRVLLSAFNLEVQKGEIVALMGPSGIGKTKLLRAFANLDPLPTGVMELQGKGCGSLPTTEWRHRIAYIPQDSPLLPGSAMDFWNEVADGPAPENPDIGILNKHFGAPFETLSGGEKQRILLLMRLALTPEILLLDEPTSALDEENTRLVEEMVAGQTAIWVTHDRAQAERVATRVVELTGESDA